MKAAVPHHENASSIARLFETPRHGYNGRAEALTLNVFDADVKCDDIQINRYIEVTSQSVERERARALI